MTMSEKIMKITAKVENSKDNHKVTLQTNDNVHSIVIPPKSTGYGSSANGGELLFLALPPAIVMTSTAKLSNGISKWNALKWK